MPDFVLSRIREVHVSGEVAAFRYMLHHGVYLLDAGVTSSKSTLFVGENMDISKVLDWFSVNILLHNEEKTNCVKFTLHNVRQTVIDVTVKNDKINL